MTVIDNATSNEYIASASQTVFTYTFEIVDKDDIEVQQNGVVLAEGTNYTVTGVGNDNGGTIVLTVGATAGDILLLFRDMALERLTTYQQQGDFLATDVNFDFDRLWLAVQQTLSKGGGQMVGDIDMRSNLITDLGDAITAKGAVNLSQLQNQSFQPVQFSTTLDLIASTDGISPADTHGYKDIGDGGKGSWVKTGVIGLSPVSQNPAQRGDALITDGGGVEWSLVHAGKINVRALGGDGVGVVIDTPVFNAAKKGLANIARPNQGGIIHVPPGVWLVSGFQFENFIVIEGAGHITTVLRTPDGANENLLSVAKEVAGAGLNNITLDGNNTNNLTSGHGLFFEGTANDQGDSFLPYRAKTGYLDTDEQSTKHFFGHHFVVGACRKEGIHKADGAGFQVILDNFVCSHNAGHGFLCGGTDGIYTNFWISKNNKAGINVINGANKFLTGKVIWNNRDKAGWAGFHVENPGSLVRGLTAELECQDNYGDGAFLKRCDQSHINISSNQNGYLAVGSEDLTDGVSSNLVFDSCVNTTVDCESFTYKTAVSPTDSMWTTEFPYKLIGTNVFKRFQISNDGNTNENPTTTREILSDSDLMDIGAFSVDGSDTFVDIDIKSQDSLGDKILRFFRNTATGASTRIDIHAPNSTTIQHRLRADGNVQLCSDTGDVLVGQTGLFNGGLLRLGTFRMWFDASGRLRVKDGSDPSTESDGTIIGTQS